MKGYPQCLIHETICGKYSKNKEWDKKMDKYLHGQPAVTAQRIWTKFKKYLQPKQLYNFLKGRIERGSRKWGKTGSATG